MTSRILRAAALASVVFCLAPPPCIAARKAKRPQRTLTLRITDEPETLDWNRAHTAIEPLILMNIMEGLVSFDSKLHIVPGLAESWKITNGGKTYTFKLRPGVKWSDGVPLKAGDFVYGWQRLLSPLTAASYAYLLFDVVGAKDYHDGKTGDPAAVAVRALNDSTLQVQLIRPVSYWLQLMTFWPAFPVRKDLVEKYGSSWASPGSLVTLGPYQLIDHDLGRKYGFVAYPGYKGPRGNVERFYIRIVKSDQDALAMYENGDIDALTEIGGIDPKVLKKRKDVKTFPHLKTFYMGFSVHNYPFELAHVRRALAMAINRTEIAKSLIGATPATSFVPPPLQGYSRDVGLRFDPRQARRELLSSGFVPSGDPFTLLVTDWDEEAKVASMIRDQLFKALGVKIEIRKATNVTFHILEDLHADQLFVGVWGADFADADNFLSVFVSDSGNNRCGWKNAQYDSVVTQAREATQRTAQEKLRRSAQDMLEDQAIILPLFYQSTIALVHARVHGFSVDPLGYTSISRVNVAP